MKGDDEDGASGAPAGSDGVGIRRLLFDFWAEATGGGSAASRLRALLTDLWDPSIAGHWVSVQSPPLAPLGW